MIEINGNAVDFVKPESLAAVLNANGFITDRIVVERNGELVPRGEYECTILCDGDIIEVLQFVGGG